MTYEDAMTALNTAIYDAVRAADNHDGAPVHHLKEIASEIDCLIDHNCTRAEMRDARALYEGAKLAGVGVMTLHDKSTSADIAAHIYAPPRYDDLPDPTLHPQEELAAGAGALLWCIAAAVVCLVTVFLVWVTG